MRSKRSFQHLLLAIICAISTPSAAESLRETIRVEGYPLRQYLGVVAGREIKFYRANLEQIADGFNVSVDLEPPTDALVAAVVELNNGSVVSSALHQVGDELLSQQSSSLAQERIDRLLNDIAKSSEQLLKLEEQVATQNSKLRAKAGLSDVDRIYRRIEELDGEIDLARIKQEQP